MNIGTFKIAATDGWVLLSDLIGVTFTAGTSYQFQSQSSNFFRILSNPTLPTNADNGIVINPSKEFIYTAKDGENLYIRAGYNNTVFTIVA